MRTFNSPKNTITVPSIKVLRIMTPLLICDVDEVKSRSFMNQRALPDILKDYFLVSESSKVLCLTINDPLIFVNTRTDYLNYILGTLGNKFK